jgi:hypothetical protein
MAGRAGDRRDRKSEPETGRPSDTDRTEFSSSKRAAEAWAETPESWRKVQAEQLDDALTALRAHEDSEKKAPADTDTRRARRGLIRRLSH